MGDAELYGIDLDVLEGERFTHVNHWRVMRKHYEAVRMFEFYESWLDYVRIQLQLEAEAKVNAEALRESVKRNKKREKALRVERERGYVFSDEQMRIADNSLR